MLSEEEEETLSGHGEEAASKEGNLQLGAEEALSFYGQDSDKDALATKPGPAPSQADMPEGPNEPLAESESKSDVDTLPSSTGRGISDAAGDLPTTTSMEVSRTQSAASSPAVLEDVSPHSAYSDVHSYSDAADGEQNESTTHKGRSRGESSDSSEEEKSSGVTSVRSSMRGVGSLATATSSD